MQDKIKKIVLFIVCFFCTYVLAQQSKELSFDECNEAFNKGNLEYVIPSLFRIQKELETSSNWDEPKYQEVVLMVLTYYSAKNDLWKMQDYILRIFSFYNQSNKNVNTELTRMLWLQLSQIEVQLRNYDLALEYL